MVLNRIRHINAKARDAGIVGSVAQFENLATHAQYRVPYEIAATYVSRGDRVLDWGCGNGHFSFLLEDLGARVTGYSFEPPPASLAASPTFQFMAGSEADPRTLPFPSASFDAACSVGVLEHVWETGGDEASSLAELARVLKPGGIFLTFHLPNRYGWIEPVTRRTIGLEYYHRRRYRRPDIMAMWSQAGFSVESIGTYNFLPRNQLRKLPRFIRTTAAFAWLYTMADRLLGRVLGALAQNYYVVARKAG